MRDGKSFNSKLRQLMLMSHQSEYSLVDILEFGY